MSRPSNRQRTVTRIVASLVGVVGSATVTCIPAAADPPIPTDVWIECSGFSGPNTMWPHPLTGCVARGEDVGTGYTQRTQPGTETIYWNAPFLNGSNFQLTSIANGAPADGTSCPADHPVRVGVSGVISAKDPGSKQFDGSPVQATICANATDFVLAQGSLFTIYKK